MTRHSGPITKLLPAHYGFIDTNVQFHENDLIGITWDELRIGETVDFDLFSTSKGERATRVSKAVQ